MKFHERMRSLRKEKGMTQKEMAAELGVGYRALQCYEYNERYPDALGLVAIADYFDISLDYLMGRSDVRDYQRSEDYDRT